MATVGMTAGTNGQISVYDAANGKLKIVLSTTLVDSMIAERGDRAHYYYSKPDVSTNNRCQHSK